MVKRLFACFSLFCLVFTFMPLRSYAVVPSYGSQFLDTDVYSVRTALDAIKSSSVTNVNVLAYSSGSPVSGALSNRFIRSNSSSGGSVLNGAVGSYTLSNSGGTSSYTGYTFAYGISDAGALNWLNYHALSDRPSSDGAYALGFDVPLSVLGLSTGQQFHLYVPAGDNWSDGDYQDGSLGALLYADNDTDKLNNAIFSHNRRGVGSSVATSAKVNLTTQSGADWWGWPACSLSMYNGTLSNYRPSITSATSETVVIDNVTYYHYIVTPGASSHDHIYLSFMLPLYGTVNYNRGLILSSYWLDNIYFSQDVIGAATGSTDELLHEQVGWLRSIFNSIKALPETIWSVFSDGLKGLFIPSADQMEQLHDQLEESLSTKLGVVWTAFDVVLEILQGALTCNESGTIHFPGISLDLAGSTFVIESADVNVWPDGFDVLQAAVRSGCTMVLLFAWFNGLMRIKDRLMGDGDV